MACLVCVSSAEDTETGKKVAIKKIPNTFNDLTDAKRILREIKLMRHFEHENVRRLLAIPFVVCLPFHSRWAKGGTPVNRRRSERDRPTHSHCHAVSPCLHVRRCSRFTAPLHFLVCWRFPRADPGH